jgi:hypothetical protein
MPHRDRHVRMLGGEALDDLGENVTGLGMGGGDQQRAGLVVSHVVADRPDVIDFLDDISGHRDDTCAFRGHARQPAAPPFEDREAQFLLQKTNLLADARLIRLQDFRGARNIEFRTRYLADVSQLTQVHSIPKPSSSFHFISFWN